MVHDNHSAGPEGHVLANNLVVGAEQEGVVGVDHARGEAPPNDEDHFVVFGHVQQRSGQVTHVRQHFENPREKRSSTLG